MLKLGILGSGSGTNYQAIQDAIDQKKLDAEAVCVLSDIEDALILERASRSNIPSYYIDCAPFKTKLDGEAEKKVIAILQEHGVELVVLAGFMRMIKSKILEAFPGQIINIHPSLLPVFPGLKSWEQAYNHGVKIAGCTVHYVDDGMDTGPIIIQKSIPVLENDTPSTLHARIQEQEYIAYPEAIAMIAASEPENKISDT